MKKFRHVEFYKEYFEEFFENLPPKVQSKIIWTLELIEDIEVIPESYLKYIEDGIYEIRIKFGSNIYRLFAFFDKGKLIVVLNGFQKKTRKTPKSAIKKAKEIRKEYETEK